MPNAIPEILYEDREIVVLNKPAGLVVNRAETQKEDTLEAWLTDERGSTLDRGGIVHRLDKDTSGVLVVAKTNEALITLQKQFFDRTTQKEYVALCHDTFREKEGVIRQSIARNPFNRHKFTTLEGGRASETGFLVKRYYVLSQEVMTQLLPELNKNQKRYYEHHASFYTLVSLFPKTGRTHQIRVHLLSLRHPIVSDTVYTSRKLLRLDTLWCQRQFLHAKELSFDHPKTGERVTFEAPLPEDLTQALKVLHEDGNQYENNE